MIDVDIDEADVEEETCTPTMSARDIVVMFVARCGVEVDKVHLEELVTAIDHYTASQVGAFFAAAPFAPAREPPPPDLRVRWPLFLLLGVGGAVAGALATIAVQVIAGIRL